jgi:hypothetical protein
VTTHKFNQEQLDRLCNEVLTSIEVDEARLLHWGFIRVKSDLKQELPHMLTNLHTDAQHLWDEAKQAGVTADDILANLLERKLIFESQQRYRSRFAETVRLLHLLRQRFSPKDWLTGSRLVSDMRIQLQRRRYPKRDIPIEDLLKEVQHPGLSNLQRDAIDQLLRLPDGTAFNLAQFQVAAMRQQFHNLNERGDRALVIGAGTGAGKTKAFYIPALAEIVATISGDYFTKVLAIYPRIELLKDQLAEAYTESHKLDALLKQAGKRPITLGAYYGDTPLSAKMFFEHPEWHQSWKLTESHDGWICPYMACPNPECSQGELVWSQADVKQEAKENKGRFARLRCQSCGTEVDSNHLILTREQMVSRPPDILFTTTEMLNRRLSRVNEHALFGIGVARPPRLVLLDEIHAYEGMTGAQVAYLLRRWRYARGSSPQRNVCIVGLSATLIQAEQFFAKLTGIPLYHVQYICPSDEDMVEEGIEYNLVIKGDPVSGTSLLSTSVQTVMLLGRILDLMPSIQPDPVSRGAYGHKIFAFTDKLDVINRWYHIEVDAETRKVLSQHRKKSSKADKREQASRNEMGQRWWVCEEVGHDLKTPLVLDLTSSQYHGVRADANLVIATSTLEVGFNDPAVGAVVQHKSPRSLASFLQRKGRAGRTRTMRPWMIVVTSAYGRDRWAFQHAETLFNPTLRPIELPLENTYVRKIQAAFVLMDWLALVLKQHHGQRVDLWELLNSSPNKRTPFLRNQRHLVCDKLKAVLRGGSLAEQFTEYLQGALGLQSDDASMHALLWGEPRPLLLEVMPTLLRQLESDWQRLELEQGQITYWSDTISANPMPDFVPSNLFSALNIPELALHIPDTPKPTPPGKKSNVGNTHTNPLMRDDEYLPLALGMVEFAPGHVSKRFARSHLLKEAHWLELPDEDYLTNGMLPLKCLTIERDELPRSIEVEDGTYLVYRPRAYTLGLVPSNVRSTSSGRLVWRSHFLPQLQSDTVHVEGEEQRNDDDVDALASHLTLVPDSKWCSFFRNINAYIQMNGAWVEVSRLAIGVQVDTRYERGESRRRRLDFEEDEQRAALGFSLYVDALKFEFQPLDASSLVTQPCWATLSQHLAPDYFLYRLQHDERLLEAELSSFEIGWLWQLLLSLLVATAIAKQCQLSEAVDEVRPNLLILARRTLRVIFQTQQPEQDEDQEEVTGRLHQTLIEHLENPVVCDALFDNATVLWRAPDHELESWLQQCYAFSLGAVLFASVTQIVPDIDPDELVMDVTPETIWISEVTAGGIGLVAKIADAIARHPHEFDLQLLDTIQNCDREQLAIQLRAVARLFDHSPQELATIFAQLRNATDIPTQRTTSHRLAKVLEDNGIPATRELIVAINSRFLRPNSDNDTDQLIALLVRHWEAEEQRLGCAIDLRVMAVVARKIPEIETQVQSVLQRIGAGTTIEESQIFNLLQSLLWLNCQDSCPDCIEHYFPYQEQIRPSRALLMALLQPDTPPIVYADPGWDEQVNQSLTTHYQCQIACEQGQLEACKMALVDMLTRPVEVGYQFFYPVIKRIARRGRQWHIDLVIRELIRA